MELPTNAEGKPVGFYPNPGPQTDFLQCEEFEALYGGAAGAGKSVALLMDAVREYRNKNLRAIIFRRAFVDMLQLIEEAKRYYGYMGGAWVAGKKMFVFPSGATVQFAHASTRSDMDKYQGPQFSYVAFDELTHWEDDYCWTYMISRLRSPDPSLCLRIRGATNPGGRGHSFVKKRFNIPGHGGPSIVKVRFPDGSLRLRRFFPGRIKDNPFLAGTDYESNLDALSPTQRKMLKDGRWDVVAGAAFEEFDHDIHVCDPFAIPYGTKIWRGGDDGYADPAVAHWGCELDGTIYVIRELYGSGWLASDFGDETVRQDHLIRLVLPDGRIVMNTEKIRGTMDASAFNEVGIEPGLATGRAQKMNQKGAGWMPSQKGPGSRVARKNLLHEALSVNPKTGKPGLIIFRSCMQLVEDLPVLPLDEKNPEDVDTNANDHTYDSLCNLLQHRRFGGRMARITGI